MTKKPAAPKKPAVPPLSHSSAQTLLGCEQKYVYYKLLEEPKDADYKKSGALAIGSAFHWILENSKHEKPKSITDDLKQCSTEEDIQLSEDDYGLVQAMIIKYLRLHKKLKLKVITCEPQILTTSMNGYIDVIEEDEEGIWWITDLKTAKTFYPSKVRELAHDPQLNLYAAHRAILADTFGLDPTKFGGCRYRVTTKSSAKQQAKETYIDFVLRLANKHVRLAAGFFR